MDLVDRRYELVHPIANVTTGGFVYAARHVVTRKPCALKLLDRDATEKVRKRARREMDALAAVQGPGVVDFRDAGECDGRLYIVLELLEGRTLAGLLAAKGKLSIEQTLRVGIDIADALSRCHERGVAHRDIKPANVFITTSGAVQLLDFGIAKLIDGDAQVEKLTQENTLVGTPEYMAPEALLMSPSVDARVDQYALAITLFECLAGAVPFEGTYGRVLEQVMSKRIRSIREARPDVPAALEACLARALAHDPAQRFGSAKEMRDALAACGTPGEHLLENQPRAVGREVATVADSPVAKAKGGLRKRRHPRAPYLTLARVTPEGGEHVDGRVEEISESGFQFVGTRPVPDGTKVVIRFALPVSATIVELPATARWSRRARGLVAAGFEFADLPANALGDVRKYVALMGAG